MNADRYSDYSDRECIVCGGLTVGSDSYHHQMTALEISQFAADLKMGCFFPDDRTRKECGNDEVALLLPYGWKTILSREWDPMAESHSKVNGKYVLDSNKRVRMYVPDRLWESELSVTMVYTRFGIYPSNFLDLLEARSRSGGKSGAEVLRSISPGEYSYDVKDYNVPYENRDEESKPFRIVHKEQASANALRRTYDWIRDRAPTYSRHYYEGRPTPQDALLAWEPLV